MNNSVADENIQNHNVDTGDSGVVSEPETPQATEAQKQDSGVSGIDALIPQL